MSIKPRPLGPVINCTAQSKPGKKIAAKTLWFFYVTPSVTLELVMMAGGLVQLAALLCLKIIEVGSKKEKWKIEDERHTMVPRGMRSKGWKTR